MYGIYYSAPLNFKNILEKKDLEKTNLEFSIIQFMHILITSAYGECKFNELFGCRIWEMDFDLLTNPNTLRDRIKTDIKEAVKMHEHRLELTDLEIIIIDSKSVSYNQAFRMKKKVIMKIDGFIKKTNRPFNFNGYFFVGPLSYI